MKASSLFPSKYLKAADLSEREHTLTIRSVSMETISQDEGQKAVLYFVEAKKGMVLNKTNANQLIKSYGDEMDQWIGKKVTLFSMMVQFRDDLVEAIRVKVPKMIPVPQLHQAAVVQQETENPAQGVAFDDELPPF